MKKIIQLSLVMFSMIPTLALAASEYSEIPHVAIPEQCIDYARAFIAVADQHTMGPRSEIYWTSGGGRTVDGEVAYEVKAHGKNEIEIMFAMDGSRCRVDSASVVNGKAAKQLD